MKSGSYLSTCLRNKLMKFGPTPFTVLEAIV